MEAARRRGTRATRRRVPAPFRLRLVVRPDGSLRVLVLRRRGAQGYLPVARIPEESYAWFEGTLLPARPAPRSPGETVALDLDLDRLTGMRVTLLLLAARGLGDPAQAEALVHGLWYALADRDVAYWFAKAMEGPRARVLDALRVLLGVA